MFHLILRRRRITRSNTSNTRRSVSFDINTRRGVSSGIQILTSNTSNTRGSFSSDIQTLISNISNTRRRVSFDIQTPRNNRRRISNYRYVILYIKREKKWLYLSDIHTLGSNITNTKRSISDIEIPRTNTSNTRSVLCEIQTCTKEFVKHEKKNFFR